MGWTWLYLILLIAGIALVVLAALHPAAIKTRGLQVNLLCWGLAFVILVWIIQTARVLSSS